MANVPNEMRRNGRPVDPVFNDDENLFRRFAPDCFEGERLEIDAIELPDMSVNREKYGPPEWLLIDYAEWGVLSFAVVDIPRQLLHLGVTQYTFAPEHCPTRNNYPHSEVRAYCNDRHVSAKTAFLLDPEAHQRWRQLLLWHCTPIIRPERYRN